MSWSTGKRSVIGYKIESGFHVFPVQSQYKEKGAVPEEEAQIHRIRITLTSRNVKSLEKGRSHFQKGTSCF